MALSNHRPHGRTGRSPEPRGRQPRRRRSVKRGPSFVVQQHEARADYYDFRLEIDGVLVSWAIPREPAVNPHERRMARRTQDQPLDGVDVEVDDTDGDVVVWDRGTYANRTVHAMTTCLSRGHLALSLNGEKLHGGYALTRIREGDDETWLLVRRRDEAFHAVSSLHR